MSNDAIRRQLDCLQNYRRSEMDSLTLEAIAFCRLPKRHREFLPEYKGKLKKIHVSVIHNEAVLREMLKTDMSFLGLSNSNTMEQSNSRPNPPADQDEIRSLFSHVARDWSSECTYERSRIFNLVQESLRSLSPAATEKLPSNDGDILAKVSADARTTASVCETAGHQTGAELPATAGPHRILIPGAALCRLPCELTRLGFIVEANDLSAQTLLAAKFIMEKWTSDTPSAEPTDQMRIYPFLGQTCNNWKLEDPLRSVAFPDVTVPLESAGKISFIQGEFLETYSNRSNEFAAVVSIFFLDTARNPLDYIELIHRLLTPGGLWIDSSPLSYHHSDGLSLTHEQIVTATELCGFELLRDDKVQRQTYGHNVRSMHVYCYDVNFTVYRKIAK